jgi:hypothetical protein
MATRSITYTFPSEEVAELAIGLLARSYGYPAAALTIPPEKEGEVPTVETIHDFLARVDRAEKSERIHAQKRKEVGEQVDAQVTALMESVTAEAE